MVRFSINLPNFGDFADARTVARVAAAAEQAGWDGVFVWDHVVLDKHNQRGKPFGDPWMLLTAAALATSRISPFEVVVGGLSPGDPAKAHETIEPLANAGATWWDERQLKTSDDIDRLTPVLRRVEQGPPLL